MLGVQLAVNFGYYLSYDAFCLAVPGVVVTYFGNARPANIARGHQSIDPDPDGIDYHTDHHTDHHLEHHFDLPIGNLCC